ncbi:MAG: DUF5106 domain-containing protein [Bacteroidales bacterium]|nr:DUF5106 domain-containing protein [Bacteroidales bacterium]
MMKRIMVVFIMMAFLLPVKGQGYRIGVSFKGLSGDTLILGEYFTTRMIPKDTVVLDSRGSGVFEGPERFRGGLYLIYLNPNYYFDFLIDSLQVFSIATDTSDFVAKTVFQGSPDNDLFLEYKQLLRQSRTDAERYREEMENAKNKKDSLNAREELKKLDHKVEQFYTGLNAQHPGLFVTDFIFATREPAVPDSILSGTPAENDSLRYFYIKNHYFDNFDFTDVRLLHTPLYENKIKTYISRVVPQHPDSLKTAVDFLIEGSRSNGEIFRYMLITLFNHFAESKFMGMDAVYFHIAEKYYIPEATWSNPDFIRQLSQTLAENKPTLVGQTAPNLVMRRIPPEHFQMAVLDTAIKNDPHIGEDFLIHDIRTRFTILYFWEVDCGHCKRYTPALHEAYQRLKDKSVEVLSVHVINSIEGKQKWVDYINENQMFDWINCWSPYSNEYRKIYNLKSFPQLFIFDKNKKIIAKKITPEQAEEIINTFDRLDLN